uniref:DEK_C domain-containing protein n=1 Tax=Angiostrongylus cantonensis TaxID=6313 RepID=A0A0K0DJT6_ANGCA
MYLICDDPTLRQDILRTLGFSDDKLSGKVFNLFPVLPTIGDLVVAVEDLSDKNLHSAIKYFLANAEKMLKLAVLKRCWTDGETDRLDEIVRTELQQAHEGNQCALENQLPDGTWKTERMEQLKRWRTIPSINYSTFVVDDNLKTSLNSYIDIMTRSCVDGQTNQTTVLHWTLTPLDAEVQLIIRVSFPLAGPDQSTFMDIRKSLHGYFDSAYEWTHGVLLTSDLVRLHVERVQATVIELAARICVDELEEEQVASPTKLLWPFLSVVLRNTLDHLNRHEYLQYTLIPYGTCFFEPPLQARVFDLTVFMATAKTYDCLHYSFSYDVAVCPFLYLAITNVLPDGAFASFSQLLALEAPRPQRPQVNSVLLSSQTSLVPICRSRRDGRLGGPWAHRSIPRACYSGTSNHCATRPLTSYVRTTSIM